MDGEAFGMTFYLVLKNATKLNLLFFRVPHELCDHKIPSDVGVL